MTSLNSHTDIDVRQLFTQVGSYRGTLVLKTWLLVLVLVSYRGTLVAIKHINRKTVDLSRAVRKELKLVSRLHS